MYVVPVAFDNATGNVGVVAANFVDIATTVCVLGVTTVLWCC